MKISKSKQELARTISENGGWRDGAEFSAQDKNDGHFKNAIHFYDEKPSGRDSEAWSSDGFMGYSFSIECKGLSSNWHQSCLSRTEYFHLYPAPDADGWIAWNGGKCPVKIGELIDVKYRDGHLQPGCIAGSKRDTELYATTHWGNSGVDSNIIAYRLHKPEQADPEFCESVMRSIPEPEAKPTIEQLAADYRNSKDYANRKQQEADAAKAAVEAKLAELVATGKALGLVLSVAGVEPELVITVKVGDEVECVKPNVKPSKYRGMIGTVLEVDDSTTPYLVDFNEEDRIWCHEVKFINRP